MNLPIDNKYYNGTNLKPWSAALAIKERVNKEANAQIKDPIPPAPRKTTDNLKKSIGLKNFYKGISYFVMQFKP